MMAAPTPMPTAAPTPLPHHGPSRRHPASSSAALREGRETPAATKAPVVATMPNPYMNISAPAANTRVMRWRTELPVP